jgi:hypothetical protein
MGTFDYFDRKPYKTGGGGDITYKFYEIPFEYDFVKEKEFEYEFEKGT